MCYSHNINYPARKHAISHQKSVLQLIPMQHHHGTSLDSIVLSGDAQNWHVVYRI